MYTSEYKEFVVKWVLYLAFNETVVEEVIEEARDKRLSSYADIT